MRHLAPPQSNPTINLFYKSQQSDCSFFPIYHTNRVNETDPQGTDSKIIIQILNAQEKSEIVTTN